MVLKSRSVPEATRLIQLALVTDLTDLILTPVARTGRHFGKPSRHERELMVALDEVDDVEPTPVWFTCFLDNNSGDPDPCLIRLYPFEEDSRLIGSPDYIVKFSTGPGRTGERVRIVYSGGYPELTQRCPVIKP